VSARPDIGDAAGQLSCSVARLAQTASQYAHARLEQAEDAVTAEARRRLWLLVSAGAALLWLSTAALFAGFAIVAAFWETHRALAAAAVAAGFLVLAILAGWMLRAKWRQRPSLIEGLLQLLALFVGTRH
jgi:uncharacterized membrane protein YqjE